MKIEEFMIEVANQNNHRLLLWLALEMTKKSGGKVVEFGSGHGSTPYLRTYCKHNNREFESYDHDHHWCLQTGATHVPHLDWGSIDAEGADVLLIDHAPGERRKIDIDRFKDKVQIMVCHDTEPAADHGYQMRQHFDKFKYVAEIKGNKDGQGAWATVLSNFVDVRKMIGEKYGQYTVRGFESQIQKA